MELICGACHGRLLAEAPGSTVACPHCGTLLQTPVEEAPAAQGSFFPVADDGPATGPDPDVDTVRLNPWDLPGAGAPAAPPSETFQQPGGAGIPSGAPSGFSMSGSSVDLDVAPPQLVPVIRVSETGSVVVTSGEPARPAVDADIAKLSEPQAAPVVADVASPADAPPQTTSLAAAASPFPATVASAMIGRTEQLPVPVVELLPTAAVRAGDKLPISVRETAASPAPEVAVAPGIPRILFLLVFFYASAITLLCVYLIWTRPSTADLPDLAPKISKKGVTRIQYLKPEFEIPPSNVLRLGESRQYGSLRVTPLKVTRGPVEFTFYKPDVDETRAPEGPVLKLHLRFENVSADQEFVPLDPQLVFTKEPVKKNYGAFFANNFLCNAADRSRLEKHVYVLDMPPESSNWLLKDQNLDREIAPGESFECFIPTTADEIDTLSGDLVWRVHFRKGYNRQSLRGVTTLIEILFRSSDIIDEEPPQPEQPAAKEA